MLDLPTPRIVLSGRVDIDIRVRVLRSLAYLITKGSPAIEIVFDSFGGDAGNGLDIYDALRLYPGKKKGIVLSNARSIAAIILQACDERECAAHAQVLIHNGSSSVDIDTLFDNDALEKARNQGLIVMSTLHNIIVIRSGKSETEVSNVFKLNHLMSPEEALAFGLIDKII